MSESILSVAWLISILAWGLSLILFGQITAKQINKKIRDSGNYSMSVDDKVGYTLFAIALAVTLPSALAQRFILPGELDAKLANRLAKKPRDKYLGLFLAASTFSFFAILVAYSITYP